MDSTLPDRRLEVTGVGYAPDGQILGEGQALSATRDADLRALLDAHPTIGFHLDIAHAQVRGNRTHEFLTVFGERLAHVHLSDNSGRADDHLPLGAGRLDWKRLIRALKRTGYDGTITLEVFSDDRDYLLASHRKLRAAWDQAD